MSSTQRFRCPETNLPRGNATPPGLRLTFICCRSAGAGGAICPVGLHSTDAWHTNTPRRVLGAIMRCLGAHRAAHRIASAAFRSYCAASGPGPRTPADVIAPRMFARDATARQAPRARQALRRRTRRQDAAPAHHWLPVELRRPLHDRAFSRSPRRRDARLRTASVRSASAVVRRSVGLMSVVSRYAIARSRRRIAASSSSAPDHFSDDSASRTLSSRRRIAASRSAERWNCGASSNRTAPTPEATFRRKPAREIRHSRKRRRALQQQPRQVG